MKKLNIVKENRDFTKIINKGKYVKVNSKDFGIDIISTRGVNSGFYIGSREFQLAELKLLVDSVQSARFITEKKSNDLIKKIESLASIYEAKELQHQVFVTERVKSKNEKILVIIVLYNILGKE